MQENQYSAASADTGAGESAASAGAGAGEGAVSAGAGAGESAASAGAGAYGMNAEGAKSARSLLHGMRVGLGYDVHRLVEGRDLILGGVHIPYEKGLDGHSDADVLLHAIADALLGAARLGDIGKLFPDTDPAYKGADSLELLRHVGRCVRSAGFEIIDIDSVIAAQAPKLSPFRDEMRNNIAEALDIDVNNVGLKATTTERLGFEGRGEGISAQAVCLLCC